MFSKRIIGSSFPCGHLVCAMTLLVLIIAISNLYLGYAVAVRLGRYARPLTEPLLDESPEPSPEPTPDPPIVAEDEPPEEVADEEAEKEFVEEFIPQPVATAKVIPENWSELLGDVMLTDSFVEAAVHVLRLEVGDYRNSLVGVENRVRQMLVEPDAVQIPTLIEELDKLNVAWLDKQAEAAAHLEANKGNLGTLEHVGDQIEMTLLQQASQIETTCNNVKQLDPDADVASTCDRLVDELGRLLDLAHNLRDMMLEMFMAIARSAGKLHEIDERGTVDALTGLLNRTGIECVMHKWVSDDPQRERAASATIFDVDNIRAINARIGADLTDHVLGELGRILEGLTRQNRGFDMTARFAGQRFFVFFGDTGPRGAVTAVERMRQTLEASKIVIDDEEIAITVSAGVAAFGPQDTSDDLVRRTSAALLEAKKADGNKTFLDEGTGPELVTPPYFNLPGRTIELGET